MNTPVSALKQPHVHVRARSHFHARLHRVHAHTRRHACGSPEVDLELSLILLLSVWPADSPECVSRHRLGEVCAPHAVCLKALQRGVCMGMEGHVCEMH